MPKFWHTRHLDIQSSLTHLNIYITGDGLGFLPYTEIMNRDSSLYNVNMLFTVVQCSH